MRMGRAALLFWLAVTACANEDVVLFDFRGGGGAGMAGIAGVPSTGGAATGGSAGGGEQTAAGDASNAGASDSTNTESPPSCQSNGECQAGWSCDKPSCTATTGSCIPYPVCLDPTPRLVCGCDGVTYWNDCLLKQAGQADSHSGQCLMDAKPCRNAAECGGTNKCGHLFASADACGDGMFGQRGPGPDPQGNPGPPGTCWSIPNSCDAISDTLRWSECGAAAPMTCLDTCNALQTGRFFVQSPAGTCP